MLTFPDPRQYVNSVRATALIFEDPISLALLARIERLAPSEANMLVVGETGTGKELVARHIHASSRRRDGPFLGVNCGAFSENLVESELFGHERGAFTGATEARAGWFEAAEGGTLFLDEIGDLPLNLQVKLLRVLQEREVVRVGSRTARRIDVRVVAGTNVQLEQAVAAGHFREDLFYRLRVASVILPPLRQRTGDILPLARHFLRDYCKRLRYSPACLSSAAEQALLAHSWPGNIRELENVIHHALLVCGKGVIQPSDLHLSVPCHVADARSYRKAAAWPLDVREQFHAALHAWFEQDEPRLYEQIEETVIRRAFDFCHRNQVQTARLLGISRNIVRARLQRIGLLEGHGPAGKAVGIDEAGVPTLEPAFPQPSQVPQALPVPQAQLA